MVSVIYTNSLLSRCWLDIRDFTEQRINLAALNLLVLHQAMTTISVLAVSCCLTFWLIGT